MKTTDQPSYATSIASWSMAMANALDFYGYNSRAVFAETGIDLASIKSPYERLPVSSVQQVWKFAYEHTDECFGEKTSEYLNPASFHALGFAMLTSASLKDMLDRLVRYRCVISHMFFAELLEQEDVYVFSTVDERPIKTNITHDTLFCYVLGIARAMCGPDFSPKLIRLDRTPHATIDQLQQLMGAPIEFGEHESSMVFTKAQLEQPLPAGNTTLATLQDNLTEQYIAEHGLISEYMLRVKTEITGLLAQGEVSVNQVAENLHVTVRTLQRRLSDENSSYHDLLDKVRYELTLSYLSDPDTNAMEIAYKLGFNDSSSFSRNFKRWTGVSFSEYRNRKDAH